jgi:hypothetical protein
MTQPKMEFVDSSSIEAVGYDADEREIYIQFLDGGTYVYSDVDEATYEELRTADSIGSYFNRMIKPNHSYREM